MKRSLLAVVLTMSACTNTRDDGYPSLSPRAAERAGFDEPAIAPPAATVADPALDARVGEIAGKLAAVVRGFDADAAVATRAAGTSGARTVGSDAWLTAQTALAALDDWRAQASSLASDTETLAGERAASVGTPYPALETVRARTAAEAERQAAVIAALSAKLPTG